MTLKELTERLAPLHPVRLTAADLPSLRGGMELYGGTVYSGSGSIEERQVATSGRRIVLHSIANCASGVMTLGLTESGAAFYVYCDANIAQQNDFLFRIDPIASFYFAYNTSEQYPFVGGWTEVRAPDKETAIAAFRAVHPDVKKDTVNCSAIYNETDFLHKFLFGNFGAYCHEVIDLTAIANEPNEKSELRYFSYDGFDCFENKDTANGIYGTDGAYARATIKGYVKENDEPGCVVANLWMTNAYQFIVDWRLDEYRTNSGALGAILDAMESLQEILLDSDEAINCQKAVLEAIGTLHNT